MTPVCTDNPRPAFFASIAGVLAERPGRVLALAAAVIALSLVDLYLTLVYATTIGLPELNPLARALLTHGSVLDVVLWKLGTVTICVGILIRLRQTPTAEIGAWLSLATLVFLTWQWHAFSELHTMLAEVGPSIDYGLAFDHEHIWVTAGHETRIP